MVEHTYVALMDPPPPARVWGRLEFRVSGTGLVEWLGLLRLFYGILNKVSEHAQ